MNFIKKHPFVITGGFFGVVILTGYILHFDNPAVALSIFGLIGLVMTVFSGVVEYKLKNDTE